MKTGRGMHVCFLAVIVVLVGQLAIAALAPCPDCGNMVSDKAAACPKCGSPVVVLPQPTPSPGLTSFESVRNAIVFISTKRGLGSGFVVKEGAAFYVLSNAHVVDSGEQLTMRMLDGTVLRWSHIEEAESGDLARIRISNPPDALKVIPISTRNIGMGESVSAYGNSLGEGVITESKGRIVGVGMDRFEVTAEIVPGNSGGPIINSTGEAIGVATYLKWAPPEGDWTVAHTRFEKPRRFAVRLKEIKWITMNAALLRKQSEMIADVDQYVADILSFWPAWNDANSWDKLQDRLVVQATKTLVSYVAEEQKGRYANTEWPLRIERFCDAYARFGGGDSFVQLCTYAEAQMSATNWVSGFLKQEAQDRREFFSLAKPKFVEVTKSRSWSQVSDYLRRNRTLRLNEGQLPSPTVQGQSALPVSTPKTITGKISSFSHRTTGPQKNTWECSYRISTSLKRIPEPTVMVVCLFQDNMGRRSVIPASWSANGGTSEVESSAFRSKTVTGGYYHDVEHKTLLRGRAELSCGGVLLDSKEIRGSIMATDIAVDWYKAAQGSNP